MQNTRFKETEIGKIPKEWGVMVLSALTSKITKGTTPTTVGGRFVKKGVNFIKVESLNDDGTISKEKFMYIDESTHELLARSKLQLNDLLYSIAGTIGRVAIVNKDILPANTNQAVAIVRPDLSKINLLYLRYALVNPKIKNYLLSKVVHAVQANLSLTEIGNCPIPIPSLDKQKFIAKILSDLDAKIELNRKMNKTLETMGQAVFKHWFVDFEFSDKKGKPYKLFGGKMIKSEFGEIPEGWDIGRFADLVSNVKEPLKPGNELCDLKYVPIESLPLKQMGMIDYKSHLAAQSSLIGFEKDDILFGAMRAYFHRVNFAPFKGVTRTTVFVLRPHQRTYLSFALFLLNMESSVHYANMHSKGSTMPYAVWDNSLSEMPVVLPPDELLASFHNLIYPFLQIISSASEENIKLSKIRDSLLPRIMSGEIRA